LSKKKIKKLEYNLRILFNKMNIKKRDNILLHSNSAGLLQFMNNIKSFDIFFRYLKRRVGENGSIVIPTYNYNFTNKKIFDYEKSRSQVGLLSNYFLKKFPKRRTLNPIFSHLIIGKKFNFLLKKTDYELLGKKSIFSTFENENFKIICFCCQPSKITFLHYLESKNKVPYRFNKIFKGKIYFKGKLISSEIRYYVGKKNINYTLTNKNLIKIPDSKNFIKASFGRFFCYCVSAKYLAKVIKKKLQKNKNFLIDEN